MFGEPCAPYSERRIALPSWHFSNPYHKRGYYAPGLTTRDRWGHFRARGGCLTAVHRQLPQRVVAKSEPAEFQHLLVEIDGWQLLNTYAPPRPHMARLAAEAAQSLFVAHRTAAGGRPWLWTGDFNEDSQPAFSAAVAAWSNPRARTDLIYTNQLNLCEPVENLAHMVSDHIPKQLTLHYRWNHDKQRGLLQRRGSWTTPPGYTLCTWRSLLEESWQEESPPRTELDLVDQEWTLYQPAYTGCFAQPIFKSNKRRAATQASSSKFG